MALGALLLAASLAAGSPAAPASNGMPVKLSADRQTSLSSWLESEKPTLFLFYRPDSAMERSLADQYQKELAGRVGLRWIAVKSGSEALLKQYEIQETPTGLVFDRRGKLVVRSSDPAALRTGVNQALGVTRIDWAADDDPRMAEVEKLLGRRVAGGILRTMSLQPQYLAYINDLSRKAHFSDGFLDRRTKEMIATYVSALNKCKY